MGNSKGIAQTTHQYFVARHIAGFSWFRIGFVETSIEGVNSPVSFTIQTDNLFIIKQISVKINIEAYTHFHYLYYRIESKW